ncbi:hypothetical protein AB837_00032 [bacterium AB1]|nr:hypothetical protein AB837_00032 [bacterium AB1]
MTQSWTTKLETTDNATNSNSVNAQKVKNNFTSNIGHMNKNFINYSNKIYTTIMDFIFFYPGRILSFCMSLMPSTVLFHVLFITNWLYPKWLTKAQDINAMKLHPFNDYCYYYGVKKKPYNKYYDYVACCRSEQDLIKYHPNFKTEYIVFLAFYIFSWALYLAIYGISIRITTKAFSKLKEKDIEQMIDKFMPIIRALKDLNK